MERTRYRRYLNRYLYACAQRGLREATAAGLSGPEAVQSVLRYLRAQYPLEIEEWALLAVALFASVQQEAAPNGAEPTPENPHD